MTNARIKTQHLDLRLVTLGLVCLYGCRVFLLEMGQWMMHECWIGRHCTYQLLFNDHVDCLGIRWSNGPVLGASLCQQNGQVKCVDQNSHFPGHSQLGRRCSPEQQVCPRACLVSKQVKQANVGFRFRAVRYSQVQRPTKGAVRFGP